MGVAFRAAMNKYGGRGPETPAVLAVLSSYHSKSREENTKL